MNRALLAVVLSLAGSPAVAHAFLQHADPGAGAQLGAAPRQVTLTFSESLEPSFSGLSVTDAAGHDVEAAPAKVSGPNMSVALKPLPPGFYRVSWHAVSMDTHRTEGSYKFNLGK